jgi:Flp pilus assembly protein TadG
MSQHAGAHGRLAKLRASIAQAAADRRGVAAVEFALVAPLLLCMYFVTMEVSQAIETNKKVSRIGSMVADLVTQQSATTTSELDAIMKIGQSVMTPYYRSKPKITITAIEITNLPTSKVQVFWSRMLKDDGTPDIGPAKKGDIVTVPAAMNVPGSFLVRVDSELTYLPVIAWAASGEPMPGLTATFSQLAMKETYYYRPRMSTQIDCPNC